MNTQFNTYNHSNDELHELELLITSQTDDDTIKAKGEFLGGNGENAWHHVKGDECPPRDASYQDSIEQNGYYNVRQLAGWKHGFDADTYAKREKRMHKARASHGYNFDHRRKVTTLCKEERIERNLQRIADIERKQAKAMARRLARLS